MVTATTTGSLATVQKSPQDEDAAGMIVEAFNATSTGSSNTEEVEEDEQQQRFVGKSWTGIRAPPARNPFLSIFWI